MQGYRRVLSPPTIILWGMRVYSMELLQDFTEKRDRSVTELICLTLKCRRAHFKLENSNLSERRQ